MLEEQKRLMDLAIEREKAAQAAEAEAEIKSETENPKEELWNSQNCTNKQLAFTIYFYQQRCLSFLRSCAPFLSFSRGIKRKKWSEKASKSNNLFFQQS